ncbi:OmpW family protein [Rhizobacter sp. AJA081-3]|jgi:outer membrane protein|uniref:OmpW/AlkL family protein n=1 Tax=Rhizobacter sp. AJA081-3 TaxID=2753607 RepID=UPI001AE0C3BB|nr:OmpW family protein [Rhizobacter sp. AJA081-3]
MSHKTFQRAALALAVAGGLALPMFAQAQATPWMVRVHALNLDSANKDSTGLDLTVNNKVFPEVDISYFFTPNVAAELVLTYPQKHTVKAGGTEIGTLKHLPPTLSLQYHFTDMGAFKPYVGAGLNYTHFSSVNLPAGVDIKRNSYGLAVGAGFDYEIQKNVYFNVDVKKVQIKTTVSAGGSDIGDFKVDPLLVGVGVGFRF